MKKATSKFKTALAGIFGGRDYEPVVFEPMPHGERVPLEPIPRGPRGERGQRGEHIIVPNEPIPRGPRGERGPRAQTERHNND